LPFSGSILLSAVAANHVNGNVFVVGWQTLSDGRTLPVAALLDNGIWRQTAVPPAGRQDSLYAVKWLDDHHAIASGESAIVDPTSPCTSDADCLINQAGSITSHTCTAKGYCEGPATYTVYWDGASWSVVDSGILDPPAFTNFGAPPGFGIGIVNSSDIWVGGGVMRHTTTGPLGPWTTQSAGIPADGGSACLGYPGLVSDCAYQWFANAFAANSENDIWADGESLMHWDGVRWSQIEPPSPDPSAPGCGVINHGSVNVTQLGSGYTSPPSMVIAPPPGGGKQATAIALMAVNTYAITNGGSGYTSPPAVVIAPPPVGGVQATATATISGGVVTGINYGPNDSFGSGYTSLPAVALVGGGGRGATAVAVDLAVIDVNVTNGGSGYPSLIFNPGIPVTFSGGGGSGAVVAASGNCNQQGTNGIVSIPMGDHLVDFAAGFYLHVNADGSAVPYAYLVTNEGGNWQLASSKPQLANGVQIFAMDFNGASDGWIGGGVFPIWLGPATRAYLEHFDGAKWSEVGGTLPTGTAVQGVSAAGDGKAWVVGSVSAGALNIPFALECR
jgi:hypothetical protein